MVVLPEPDGAEKITALPVELEGIENLFLDFFQLILHFHHGSLHFCIVGLAPRAY